MDSCVLGNLATKSKIVTMYPDYVLSLCIFKLEWLTRVISFIQVGLQLSQFSSPCTAIFVVWAESFKLVEWAFHAHIFFNFKFVISAVWARLVFHSDLLAACVAEAVSTTCSFIWITKYQFAYWAFCLINLWRWFDKCTIVTTTCFSYFWPVMSLCFSISIGSLQCLGG